MTELARYAVLTAPGVVDIRERQLPDPAGDEGLLAVEACGVCGSDVSLFAGAAGNYAYPIAPGHEPFGTVVRLGRTLGELTGLREGDCVVVQSELRCGRCRGCRAGRRCVSGGRPRHYGFRHPDDAPGLWGGFGTHLSLTPDTALVPLGSD